MTKIPFEIHLTISDLSTDRLPDFERLCRDMGGKAVLIELPVGVHTQQPMLSLVQAAETLDEGVSLNARQTESAAIIAGTDRLVTVTGPAGAGKTTMLRVAAVALRKQDRGVVVLAPTKKAATKYTPVKRPAGSPQNDSMQPRTRNPVAPVHRHARTGICSR